MSEAKLLEQYFDRLWPIPRSLTGAGVRATLDILSEVVPLNRHATPSGTPVLDWIVPPEWNVREAYVVDPQGRRRLDFAVNNIHLMGYSEPVQARLSRTELDKHLYSLASMPDAVPYVTSYYVRRWGFCLTHAERQQLPDGDYEVVIDSSLDAKGKMDYADCVLPGASQREVLLSTYVCHPSLAINELSGPLLTIMLYRRLAARPKRRFTYRFLFCPETIGAVAYLARHGEDLKQRLVAGYVVTCVGDAGRFTYKRSRRGDSLADIAAAAALKVVAPGFHDIEDFFPDGGSDERQYCSPGYDLPVGSLMRTRYGRYPEYHTSKDDKSLMDFSAMVRTLDAYEAAFDYLETTEIWKRVDPRGEPQLGKRGLYGEAGPAGSQVSAMMWLLNAADGSRDLATIAARSGHDLAVLSDAAQRAEAAGLLVRV